MSLTKGGGPLAADAPAAANYAIDGPAHKLLFSPFPRRVRATFGGVTVLDSEQAMLLHETNILPVLYVPSGDVDQSRLEPSATRTHCPYKGDACYWDLKVGGLQVRDAVWGYPEPIATASWLAGYQAFYWDRVDAWFDEDDEVFGHLCDPYHRVDIRPLAATVTVTIDGEPVASTTSALLLSETGMANRCYVPRGDVDFATLQSSLTSTHCPYKGQAEYWSRRNRADVAWSYPAPFDGAVRIAGHLSFWGDGVVVDVQRTTSAIG